MERDLEPYEDRPPILPELIDYLRADRYRQDLESGRPIINIIYNEAPRAAPPAPPEPSRLAKHRDDLIMACIALAVLAGVAIVFMEIAAAMMTMMISTAVCALAITACVRSLRSTQRDADRDRRRHR